MDGSIIMRVRCCAGAATRRSRRPRRRRCFTRRRLSSDAGACQNQGSIPPINGAISQNPPPSHASVDCVWEVYSMTRDTRPNLISSRSRFETDIPYECLPGHASPIVMRFYEGESMPPIRPNPKDHLLARLFFGYAYAIRIGERSSACVGDLMLLCHSIRQTDDLRGHREFNSTCVLHLVQTAGLFQVSGQKFGITHKSVR
ncbi:hypothetical protein GUJ93_ZPchr0006g44666 [Zizania palustris]|uniref:Uncharacterized protein n=1 Tax=Zizania palustris TaxID=103762 RepID=A0A8J5S8P0_ZIZPA|nr:hypothetical protein GUJ93_ZPchr0006g44666 [Zizania palustris]KAG8071066.1 hypothetical protein GUJ93_ZPchr0006g44666 [Zizania palustris]KAG8071067.1 hypothetical protein GUJ93_ZPchr0006g44666 [Zizania palustris]KAG8071068.1 hypothetical protein GUJ93_ZPchr0006g44666 [Zizania palustris]